MISCNVNLYSVNLPEDRHSLFSRPFIVEATGNRKYRYKSQIKNLMMEQTFVVNLGEDYALGIIPEDYSFDNINYLLMTFTKDDLHEYQNYVPYYVDKIVRNTKSSIIIYATLDSVNYFNTQDYLENNFTNNCLIERTHLNRWKNYGTALSNYMNPIIDFRKEDFDIPVKYLDSSTKITDKQSGKWYAIYYSDPNNTKTGVRCFLIPKTTANYSVKVDTSSAVPIAADTMYIIRALDNPNATITIGSETLTLGNISSDEHIFIWNNGGNITAAKYKYKRNLVGNNWNQIAVDTHDTKYNLSYSFSSDVHPLVYYTIYELDLYPELYDAYSMFPILDYVLHKANYTTSTQTASVTGLNDIPKTNSRIIKIVDLPYFPCSSTTATDLRYQNVVDDFMNINVIEVMDGASFDGSSITATDYEVKDYKIDKPTSYRLSHNIQYETKFGNSAYDEMVFEYGPYRYTIQPEMMEIDHQNQKLKYAFTYKQAKLKSSFSIEFTNMSYVYKSEFGDLPNVESNFIISDMDNEIPVYNSDYINYMKNGYNYDKESIARQTTKGAVGIATSLGGAALGAALGGPVGAAAIVSMGASAVNQMNSLIISKIQAEANLAYKVNSYKNSKTAISAISDLELRHEYEADALYFRKYHISTSLKNLIYDYWRLFGYKYNEYGNPYTLVNANKRYWYNYIKLGSVEFKPEFMKKYSKYSDIIDDYKNKLLEGITIYRAQLTSTPAVYESDFEQNYENFEDGIVLEGE